jgi:hypothetical protein
MRCWVTAACIAVLGCSKAATEPAVARAQSTLTQAPLLSPTRLLRRVYLTLRNREPTPAEYDAATTAAAGGTFDAFITQQIDTALASSEFYEAMVAWGHDYLRVGDYKRGTTEGGFASWKGGMAAALEPCPAGTTHAGALGHFSGDPANGDPSTICDDGAATVRSIEPWWAPGTTVSVVGNAGSGATTAGTVDCGRLYCGDTRCHFPAAGCSCGPNLAYCYRRYEDRPGYIYALELDSIPYFDNAARRLLWEEPARLFAHVVTQDESFADLVVGDYTVAPRKLRHQYVRWGRMNSDNKAVLDASTWWQSGSNNWDKVQVATLHPNLLAARTYTFDPRIDVTAPQGIPAAGVLTMLGPSSWFPRERVRAARWLETFACRVFAAPDPSIVFTPPYTDDPARQGACQHCHRTIDPAAIHFKRLEIEDEQPYHGVGHANLGGIGDWQWRKQSQVSFPDPNSPGGIYWRQPYGRWNVSFIPNTFLTPVAASVLSSNADARFIDFLPATEQLFGQTSDGTIGPLGFGKMLVSSGEFDRCAVDRIFGRFMGRPIDISREAATEAALVQQFTSGGRKVKPLIKALLSTDEFKRGL